MSPFTRALACVFALALGLAASAGAETAAAKPEATAAPAPEAQADAATAAQDTATASDPGTAAAAGADAAKPAGEDAAQADARTAAAPPAPARERGAVTLGPVGYDAEGNPGRIHTVVKGDTLWDVSDAYLGTPWVWPSIWSENQGVENPHLIHPGELLWVTPTEIRRVSDSEAEELLAGSPAADAASADAVSYDGLPAEGESQGPPMFRYASRDAVGMVTDAQLKGASSIVDSPGSRVWLGTMDDVYVGLGRGEVEAGEQFAVIRARERVYDPRAKRPIGWHVRVLGWIEIQEVFDDVARGEVRMAFAEMREGDRVLPRELVPLEVELRPTAPGIDAQIVHMPSDRFHEGTDDVVFLDRGTADGLQVGNTLEIYRPAPSRRDAVDGQKVRVPARVVGRVVVVSAFENTAAAVVEEASSSITVGDRVRSSGVY